MLPNQYLDISHQIKMGGFFSSCINTSCECENVHVVQPSLTYKFCPSCGKTRPKTDGVIAETIEVHPPVPAPAPAPVPAPLPTPPPRSILRNRVRAVGGGLPVPRSENRRIKFSSQTLVHNDDGEFANKN